MPVLKAQVHLKSKTEQTLSEDRMQIRESNRCAVISTLTLSGFHLSSELQVYRQCTVCPEIYISDKAVRFLYWRVSSTEITRLLFGEKGKGMYSQTYWKTGSSSVCFHF